jgi:4-amino-4-deoxy-L-arabinose transferase-like glycosyltransferase
MVAYKDANQLVKKGDFIHLAILLTIAFIIGLYLIITTVLISEDGVSYINYAKGLTTEPLKIIRDPSGYAPSSYTPGYPFLILTTHKLVDLFGKGAPVLSWIYSAQATSLICRILALIPLYFIGRGLVGGRLSFWAMLVLVILPYPAQIGSDVLRDWPHMLFLAVGFLFLLRAARYGKWLMFTLAGITAGLGYMVRPECAQLVAYGVVWVIYSILRRKHGYGMNRAKLVGALALLITGFAVAAVPYMKIRAEILPQRLREVIKSFSFNPKQNKAQQQDYPTPANFGCTAGLLTGKDNIIRAFAMLVRRINENLMYYFVLPLLIGIYYHFRKKTRDESTFFIMLFLLANIAMPVVRYCCAGPALSRRYILPLTAFTIFFVPAGLQTISRKLAGMLAGKKEQNGPSHKNQSRCFFALLVIGLAICIPKLSRPIRIEKKGYRLAAEWLKENTVKEDIIAAPDNRISFYAERKGIGKPDKRAKYVVKEMKDQKPPPAEMTEKWSCYLNNKEKKVKVVIYQKI